ncbi:MAG: hypothetical protein H0V01_07815, partial [Bacteroidetes bacterium]|nr:hypothetical protein [Bacteroidota bacterium]
MRIIYIVNFLLTFSLFSHGQQIYYQDVFNGGVTVAGFSFCMGAGNGNFNVYIEPGSTVRKAFLFSYKIGIETSPADIKLNGKIYNINNQNKVSKIIDNFIASAPNYSIHAVDITNDISPIITNYNIEIPPQPIAPCLNCVVGCPYIVILYENPILPVTNLVIVLNDKNTSVNNQYYLSKVNPINSMMPVGMSIISDRMADTIYDGSYVYVENNLLGLIGGSDAVNELFGCGVKGHFYYQNNQLFGLDDDIANNVMKGSDGLADIKNQLTYNSISFNYKVIHQGVALYSNPLLGFNFAYNTTCNPFTTTIAKDTTICSGTKAQLTATGGINYEWLPQQNLSCYNCPNPVFAGQKTTTYTCRIWSTDSCSKVLPVRVLVKEPRPDTVNVTNGICGDNNGSFKLGQLQNGTAPFVYSIAGQTNTTGNFTGLGSGTYTYKVTDAMGCVFSDTVSITETNQVKAGYLTQKFKDEPLKIGFINNSKNATHYIWVFPNGDTLYSENFTQLFDSGGTYEVMLIAYNTYPHCSDTVMHT